MLRAVYFFYSKAQAKNATDDYTRLSRPAFLTGSFRSRPATALRPQARTPRPAERNLHTVIPSNRLKAIFSPEAKNRRPPPVPLSRETVEPKRDCMTLARR